MPRRAEGEVPPRPILVALATLYDVTFAAHKAPVPRSMLLQALLWLLYAHSDKRDRQTYSEFWKYVTGAKDGPQGETINATIRGGHGRVHWHGIVRSLGYNPGDRSLTEAIHRERVLARDGPAGLDPSIEWASIKDRMGIWTREIIATKGRPFSEGAKKLMADRIAQGKPIDGSG